MKKKDVFLSGSFRKTYTIDMLETNMDELKEQAIAFLKQIHPDLVKVKENWGQQSNSLPKNWELF